MKYEIFIDKSFICIYNSSLFKKVAEAINRFKV